MKKIIVAICVLPLLVGGIALAHVAEHRTGLSGENVIPGPGDQDASGRVRIRSASEAETVCYKIFFKGMRKPTSGHIHLGGKDEEGEKVVKLFASKNGKSSPIEGCRHKLPGAVIEQFHDNPSYVDLHNGPHPEGAVRGQLREVE